MGITFFFIVELLLICHDFGDIVNEQIGYRRCGHGALLAIQKNQH